MSTDSFIILSAQPGSLFYEWQLEIQFINLAKLGYDLANYHVLVGYRKEIREEVISLASRYPQVNWNFYPDTRIETRTYVSSLRPHIIKKHFERNPWLEKERIFYIDSDVIFRALPPLSKLNDPNVWYFSKTEYISIEGIKEKGDHILNDLCQIIGIDKTIVSANISKNGGAQIWLNNTDANFWHKMEIDSTRVHDYLKLTWPIAAKIWSQKTGQPVEKFVRTYEYLADMWTMLWNGLLLGKELEITPILDFCTPSQELDFWDNSFILHYSLMARCTEPDFFLKPQFARGVDLNWSSKNIRRDVCAAKYVELLDEVIERRKSLAY